MRRSIRQALADDALKRAVGSGNVIHAQRDPIGVTEIKLGKITVHGPMASGRLFGYMRTLIAASRRSVRREAGQAGNLCQPQPPGRCSPQDLSRGVLRELENPIAQAPQRSFCDQFSKAPARGVARYLSPLRVGLCKRLIGSKLAALDM